MIDLKSGSLLPWHFRFVGLLLLIIAAAVVMSKLLLALILLVVGLTMISAIEGTEIDTGKKVYREYTQFFFFLKTGKMEKYESVERIFIIKSKESQQLYTAHTTHSSTFEKVVYNAYLKFSNGEKVHLLKGKNKDALLKKLIPVCDTLDSDLVDHS